MVCRGTTPLAEASSFDGNFRSVAERVIQAVDTQNERFTTEQGEYAYYALSRDNMIYLVQTAKKVSSALAVSFCDDLYRKWIKKYSQKQVRDAEPYSKSEEFRKEIMGLFRTYNSERAQKNWYH